MRLMAVSSTTRRWVRRNQVRRPDRLWGRWPNVGPFRQHGHELLTRAPSRDLRRADLIVGIFPARFKPFATFGALLPVCRRGFALAGTGFGRRQAGCLAPGDFNPAPHRTVTAEGGPPLRCPGLGPASAAAPLRQAAHPAAAVGSTHRPRAARSA